MQKNKQYICKAIASKLAMRIDAVEKWVITNDYDLLQLSDIMSKITYKRKRYGNAIMMAIMDNKVYKIR